MTWRFWTKSKVGIPCELHAKKRIGQYNDLQKKVIHDNDLQISDIVQHILKKVFCYNISFIIKSDSILQSHWQKAQKQSLPWSVTVIRFAWPSTWLARAWCLQIFEYFSFQISEYFVAKLSLSESWKKRVLAHQGSLNKDTLSAKGFWAGWFSVEGGGGYHPIPLRKIPLKRQVF